MTAPPRFALGALIAHTGAHAFAPRRVPTARGSLRLGVTKGIDGLGIAGRADQVFGDAVARSVDWLAVPAASMVDVDNPAWNGRALVEIVAPQIR
jgi:hypothetical protein